MDTPIYSKKFKSSFYPRQLRNIGLICGLMLSVFYAYAQPERIISIGGDITEIIAALGEEKAIIARDSTSTIPETILQLPDIGYMRQLNSEGILAQKPDLILASEDAGPASVFAQIEAIKVPIIRITAEKSIDSTKAKIEQIGQVLGQKKAATQLINRFDEELSQVNTDPLPYKALFILAFEGSEPSIAGSKTAPDTMFRYLGIMNAAAELVKYRPLSAEGIIAMKPDVLVLSERGLAKIGIDNIWSLPGISMTPAGQKKRLVIVDDNGFLGFTLQTPDVLKQTRAKFEAFE